MTIHTHRNRASFWGYLLPLAAVSLLSACDSSAGSKAAGNNMSGVVLSAIPAEFHGRWGSMPTDCDPANQEARGLIVVGDKDITLFASKAVLKTAQELSPNRVKIDFAVSGEGRNWDKAMTLALEEGGKVLARTEHDPTATVRYTKCP